MKVLCRYSCIHWKIDRYSGYNILVYNQETTEEGGQGGLHYDVVHCVRVRCLVDRYITY